jgi:hypothetical protein
MSKSKAKIVTLGDLIEAAYDCARTVTPESAVAARLATRTVAHLLARTGRNDLARRLAGEVPPAWPSRVEHRQAA